MVTTVSIKEKTSYLLLRILSRLMGTFRFVQTRVFRDKMQIHEEKKKLRLWALQKHFASPTEIYTEYNFTDGLVTLLFEQKFTSFNKQKEYRQQKGTKTVTSISKNSKKYAMQKSCRRLKKQKMNYCLSA